MTQTFYQIVSEAIRDFEEHGFDSVERLTYWTERIRQAAIASLVPEEVLDETLRRTLSGVYKRMVDDGQILKAHKGVSRFTVDKLKPQLKGELDRRLMVSRNLIKLNRQQMIEETTRRFAGWASSVPDGGSNAVDVKDAKENIRKAMTSLPFAERRVHIDQGHKFVGALNEIIAVDGGAIAMRWHSKYRQPGYRFRIDHKERDGHIYLLRSSWAKEKGLVKPGAVGYYDDITKVGQEVSCFPGDSKVPYAGLVEKAFRRWYEGALTEIITDSGKTIRATPNHPVLTSTGWKAIGSLNEGDDIIEVAEELIKPLEENQYHGVPSIAEIFGSVEENGVIETLDLRSTDFHGDGRQGDVDVVFPAGELTFNFMTPITKGGDQLGLAESHRATPGLGNSDQLRFASNATASGVMGILNKRLLFVVRKLGHAVESSLNAISKLNTRLLEAIRNGVSGNAKAFGDGQHAFATEVGGNNFIDVQREFVGRPSNLGANFESDRRQAMEEGVGLDADDFGDLWDGLPFASQRAHVVKINRSWFSGHVFNLQTEHSLYVVNGIVAHNCSCWAEWIYLLRDLPPDMLTRKGEEALAEARAKIAAMRT